MTLDYTVWTPSPQRIPSELRAMRRWIRWRLEEVHEGKWTKRPNTSTRDGAWTEFEHTLPDDTGRGLVMTGGIKNDREATLLALDLDACVDPETQTISTWAQDIVELLDSYTEVSVSGFGLRVFVWVEELPPTIKATAYVAAKAPPGCTKKPQLQIFGLGPAQFVTVSGQPLTAYTSMNTVPTINWLCKQHNLLGGKSTVELPKPKGLPPSMAEIDEHVRAMPQGAQLVDAHWEEVVGSGKSASEAFYMLALLALDGARDHGPAAVDYLLGHTAWGCGMVEGSHDVGKYARRDWVEKEVARVLQKRSSGTEVFQPIPDGVDPTIDAEPKRRPLLEPVDLAIERCKEQQFLVQGILPRQGLVQFYGDPGCGKTPYALSLSLHVAADIPRWFNGSVRNPGSVIYLAGEDRNGILNRVKAECLQHGIDPSILHERFFVSTRPADLSNADDVRRWLDAIYSMARNTTSLIVADTQSRNFGTGDENSTQDMTMFVSQVDAMTRALDALMLLNHHTGHGEKTRGRGSSVLLGALDGSWKVTRNRMIVTAESQKEKNWAKPNPLVGELNPVTIGKDIEGIPVTAITLRARPPEVLPTIHGTVAEDEDDERAQMLADIRQLCWWVANHTSQEFTANDMRPVLRVQSERTVRRRIEQAQENGYIVITKHGRRRSAVLTDLGRVMAAQATQ